MTCAESAPSMMEVGKQSAEARRQIGRDNCRQPRIIVADRNSVAGRVLIAGIMLGAGRIVDTGRMLVTDMILGPGMIVGVDRRVGTGRIAPRPQMRFRQIRQNQQCNNPVGYLPPWGQDHQKPLQTRRLSTPTPRRYTTTARKDLHDHHKKGDTRSLHLLRLFFLSPQNGNSNRRQGELLIDVDQSTERRMRVRRRML